MNKFSLKEYIELLENEGLLVETYKCEDVLDKQVNLLSYNSKEVEEDTLFVVEHYLVLQQCILIILVRC